MSPTRPKDPPTHTADTPPPTPASLAAAAYDLWQTQWELLRSDPAVVEDLQIVLEQFGRSMAGAFGPPTRAAEQGAAYAQAIHSAFATSAANQASGAKPPAAASGAGQYDLAQLAAAVAALNARLDRIEAQLEPPPASKGRSTGRRQRKASA